MPRIKHRGEVFEILFEYKQGDLDIGEAYDLIYNEIKGRRSPGNLTSFVASGTRLGRGTKTQKKRKLSAWNKFVKANAKKPRFRLRSGSPNLKKLGVAFRKTPAGRKSKRR